MTRVIVDTCQTLTLVQVYSVKLSLVLTWSMFLIVTILIVPLSKPLAIIYVLSVLFVTFVCPYWLKWVQQYKKYVITT